MYFQQFLDDRLGCLSYIMASGDPGEAVVVDPGYDISRYLQIVRERNLRLRFVIDTHIHADHVSGARKLVAETGADLYLHKAARTAYPYHPLHDAQELTVGDIRLRIMHTPGHRPELVTILVIDPARSAEPLLALTGDSLLVGDVGRPDFGGGDAQAQFRSVQQLLGLPEWTAIFPGHFEGPCGASMHGTPSSNIGAELRFNPLAPLGEDAFVAALVSAVPPRPLNITAIEATNRGHANLPWAMLTTSPQVRQIDIAEVVACLPNATLIDVREPEEFAVAHVDGAVNIPQADLATRLLEIPRHQPVICICQAGRRSLRAAQFLAQVGFPEASSVQGGMNAWLAAGYPAGSGAEPARHVVVMH